MQIDPVDYALSVTNAEAELEGAQADLPNRQAEAKRRTQLSALSTLLRDRRSARIDFAGYRRLLGQWLL